MYFVESNYIWLCTNIPYGIPVWQCWNVLFGGEEGKIILRLQPEYQQQHYDKWWPAQQWLTELGTRYQFPKGLHAEKCQPLIHKSSIHTVSCLFFVYVCHPHHYLMDLYMYNKITGRSFLTVFFTQTQTKKTFAITSLDWGLMLSWQQEFPHSPTSHKETQHKLVVCENLSDNITQERYGKL